MDAATLIRESRVAAGLTQVELARRAGTSQPAIARYESGTSSPSLDTLERVLRAAGRRFVLDDGGEAPAVDFSGPKMRALRSAKVAIEHTARRVGAENVRVFGSVARGQDTAESDVDLLVDFDAKRHGVMGLIRLRRELSEMLDMHVDVTTPAMMRPEALAHALIDAVSL